MKTHNKADLLTEANLMKHTNRSFEIDNNQSIIDLIKQEATQDFEQAHWKTYHDTSSSSSSTCPLCQAGVMNPDVDKLSTRYPPLQPSNGSPMERFGILSTANDPAPFMTRMEMERAGITHGSLETIEVRRNAAATAAETSILAAMEAESDGGSDTRPHEMPHEVHNEYQRAGMPSVGQLAVVRTPMKRRRVETAATQEKRRK